MENNTLFQLFKDHFDAIAIFATFFVGYFQIRTMMREEIKHITDPIKDMMDTQIARLDAHMLDGNRKWEANERRWAEARAESEQRWVAARAESEQRWAEMRKESQLLMQKIHCIELDQAKKQ